MTILTINYAIDFRTPEDLANIAESNTDEFLSLNPNDIIGKSLPGDQSLYGNSICIGGADPDGTVVIIRYIKGVIDVNLDGLNQINLYDINKNKISVSDKEEIKRYNAIAKAAGENQNVGRQNTIWKAVIGRSIASDYPLDSYYAVRNTNSFMQMVGGMYLHPSISSAEELNPGAVNYIGECLNYGESIANLSSDNSFNITTGNNICCEVVGNYAYVGPLKYNSSSTSNIKFSKIEISSDGNISQTIDSINSSTLYIKGNNGQFLAKNNGEISKNTEFYIKVNKGIESATKIGVKIYRDSASYYKARFLILERAETGTGVAQSLVIYGGKKVDSSAGVGSEITFDNDLGALEVYKKGIYAGTTNTVGNLGFKIFYKRGNDNIYLRINDADKSSNQEITVYKVDETKKAEEATIIYTKDSEKCKGWVKISNLHARDYYIEEVECKNYDTKILSAKCRVGKEREKNLTINENIAGPISVQKYKEATQTMLILEDAKIKGTTLELLKKDADSNKNISGVKFKIKNSDTGYWVKADLKDGKYTLSDYVTAKDATEFITNETGVITIDGLDVGMYSATETGSPYMSKIVISSASSSRGTVSIANDKCTITGIEVPEKSQNKVTVTIKDQKQTGTLDIIKRDLDNNGEIKNVQFKIKEKGGNYLRVNNQDAVTGEIVVSDTGYTTTSVDKATVFITNEKNGEIKIANIPIGKYEIIEIYSEDVDYGYYSNGTVDENNIYWSTDGGKTKNNKNTMEIEVKRQSSSETSNANTNKYNQIIIYNEKQTGTLNIIKKDKDITDEAKNKLSNVSFKLYEKSKNGYVVAKIGSNKITPAGNIITGSVTLTNMENVASENDATTFVTDANGAIKIENLRLGEYEITEVSVGENAGYEVDNDYIWWSTDGGKTQKSIKNEKITITVNKTTKTESTQDNQIIVYNQRKYIDLEGRVWEDVYGGKTNQYDEVYTNNDIKLKGIVVNLKDNSDNIVATTTTNEEGKYEFNKVLINNLPNYYVEFEYDGVIYTNLKTYIEKENSTSKAQEVEAERVSVDNRYERISGDGTRNRSIVNGNGEMEVTYNTKDGTNTEDPISISKNIELWKGQLDGKVRDINEFEGYENYDSNKIYANTKETGYNVLGELTVDQIRKNGVSTIKDIDLGLIEREQVDLSITTTLEDVIVKVNGYTNTYVAPNNIDYTNDYNTDDEIVRSAEDKFRLDMRMNRWGIQQNLRAADILFNGTDTCQVYMTYKITVTNNSRTLNANVYRIANYYDANYERQTTVQKVGTDGNLVEDTDRPTIIATDGAVVQGNKYMVEYIDITDGALNATGGKKDIYVQYKLKREAVVAILSGNVSLESVTEICSYSTSYGTDTYYHTGNGTRNGVYASIDSDSAPQNIVLGENKTYEDDTSKAPTVTMTLLTSERVISGNVFEDNPEGINKNEANEGKERLGNGKLDNDENSIGGVTVELHKYDASKDNGEGDLASVWKQNAGNVEGIEAVTSDTNTLGYKVPATTTTNKNGEYTIDGIVPDEYLLKFTYGDGSVIYKMVGNEQTKVNDIDANYYKSTIIPSGQGIRVNKDQLWYKTTENNGRYSDAIDEKTVVDAAIKEDYIKFNHETYANNKAGVETKSAYTLPMNIQLEINEGNADGKNTTTTMVKKENSDGTWQVETVTRHVTRNIDFGIIEKARLGYEVVKEIANIKITLANGQVLVDGDPSQKMPYIKNLNDESKRTTTISAEIDDELIYGSTLEIKYKVTATNRSELNYLTEDYYKYGEDKVNAETLKISKIIDYLSNSLVYTNNNDERIQIGDGKSLIIENSNELSYYLTENVITSAKKYSTILVLNSEKGIAPGNTESWEYSASKLLANSDTLEFGNDIEVIEVEVPGTTPPSEELEPGNYDPTPDLGEEISIQLDNYKAVSTITDPTGSDRSLTYYVIGAGALIVLATGVIIIRKIVK